MSNLVGKKLGKYRMATLLGEGGMAQVYQAHHQLLDRPVAIKVMKRNLAAQPGFNLAPEEWAQYQSSVPYRATCPDIPLPAETSVAAAQAAPRAQANPMGVQRETRTGR